MKNFYVYHLIDPITNVPFYVGKGKNQRMYKHEKLVRNGRFPNNNKHLFYTIKRILDAGFSIVYSKVYESLDESTAFSYEVSEESRLRGMGINLCNIAKCGRGGDTISNHPNKSEIMARVLSHRPSVLSESWKRNISESLRHRVVTDVTREKHRQRMLVNNPMKGRRHSPESKAKIIEHLHSRVVSPETRQKISMIHRRKLVSAETRQKLRNINLGKKMSESTRKKMSMSHVGVPKSEETRRKMSIALRGRTISDLNREKLSARGKLRIGKNNPNFRECSMECLEFVKSNIDKTIYWLQCNAPERMSYGRMRRIVDQVEKA